MSTTLQSTFQTALDFHRKGSLAAAQALYRQVLRDDPQHFDSLHLLGLTLIQGGALADGVEHIRRALALRPDVAEAHYNLGNGLLSLGRPGEALASFDRALALTPGDPQYHLERGNALKDFERLAEALESYRAAVRLAPRFAEAHNNAGVALKELGRPEEALASFDTAIALRPSYAEAYGNCGNALRELDRFEQALVSYDKALALRPDYAEAHSNRGIALGEMQRFEEALACHDRALALKPGYAEALNNRGNALVGLGRCGEALASFDAAIALKPDYAECHRNRGLALEELGRFAEALHCYDTAIRLKPDQPKAYSNRSALLAELRRLDEARDSIDQALRLAPEKPAYKANKGHLLLLQGDFENGLPFYDWRKRRRPAQRWTVSRSGTPGEGQVDLRGKRLLVYWEQGLGDTLQFSRFIRSFNDLGAVVLFSPHKPLWRLMRGLDAKFELVDDADPALSADLEIPLLSAMYALGTTLADIPAPVPYLRAEPAVMARWQQRLQRRPGELLIGICWQGGKSAIDRGRSFPLASFHGLSRLPGVRLVSLHRGEGEAQLRDLPAGMAVETLGPEFDAGADAFIDTAAVMRLCDLVITSDTSVAHLAGALGVETWVALKHVPDWRWQLDRRDSPWYPSMTLFRQATNGDWNGVFREIEQALLAFRERRRDP